MIHQTALGSFTWDEPCWTSEPTSAPLFGGAKVQVQVFGEQDDVEVLRADEVDALQRFFALPQARLLDVVPHLWRYYLDMWESVGPPDIPELTDPSTIWSHVVPRFVGVEHDESGKPYVVVEAECDWEIEHGLQLVLLEGQRWVRVPSYTGHLTDGQAWGVLSLDDWMADPLKSLPVRSREDFGSASDIEAADKPKRPSRWKWLADIWSRRE